MRVFIPPDFARFAAKEGISDQSLMEAITRADAGLIDAQLGSELIKQRVARQGQGRSGGFRTIIAYRFSKIAVFLHGFPKNAKANLNKTETEEYRAFAGYLTNLSNEELMRLSSERGWKQIDDEQPEEDVPK